MAGASPSNPARRQEPYILGLDLGANSLGWAALRIGPDGEPVGLLHPPEDMRVHPTMGVRIFTEGVENYGRGEREESRGAKRRMARLQRRQTMRRARRMAKTFRILQEAGLLPSFAKSAIQEAGSREAARDRLLKALDASLANKLAQSLAPEQRLHLHELLPYALRTLALDEYIEPHAIGRAIYHLSQRRGFLSNRKAGTREKEDGAVKEGISELAKRIDESKSRTLGEYLYRFASKTDVKLRARWTARAMYLTEFDSIWKAQAVQHPGLLTDHLYRRLRNAIFHQRPLRSQRDLIGACELEDGGEYADIKTGELRRVSMRRRAPECFLVSQRFRVVQTINNLEIMDGGGGSSPLSQEQRRRLIDELEKREKLTYSEIRKVLGLARTTKFNLEEGPGDRIKGNRTNAQLLSALGDSWTSLSSVERDAVVLELWSAPDDSAVIRRAKERRGIWARVAPRADQIDAIADVALSPDYVSLSRAAMMKLLPRMEAGDAYMTAVRRVYGERMRAEAFAFLPPTKSVFRDVRNPIVLRALNELRRVVNAIIKEYGRPEEIRIELARDLKRDKEGRKRIMDAIRDNERERQQAAERIAKEAGIAEPSTGDILKFRLWIECNGQCPYSGRSIGFAQLFRGDIDIEHIIPFSRCLDDSFLNKTLCFVDVNRNEKRNRTPFEAFGSQLERFAEMVARMKVNVEEHGMSEAKLQRFQLAGPAYSSYVDTFKSSQLNDTRHASRRAKEYLGYLYGGNLSQGLDPTGRRRVQVGTGQVTAILRRVLGLTRAMPTRNKREDHRHHAVDAVAIGLTSPSMIKRLSDAADHSWEERHRLLGSVSIAWTSVAEDVREAVGRAVVSFRIDNRVRGPLHAETLYSPQRNEKGHRAPDGTCSHIRKRLEALSKDDVANIVDKRIRELVLERAANRDPKEAFDPENPSSYPALPNAHGSPIPIRRVRVRKSNRTHILSIGSKIRHVENEENHHIELYEVRDPRGRPYWEGKIVSLAEAYERRRRSQPIVDRSPDGYLFSLAKNETVELTGDDGTRALHTVRGIAINDSATGAIQLTFLKNSDAREISRVPKKGRSSTPDALRQKDCSKVTVLPIGTIRPCRA